LREISHPAGTKIDMLKQAGPTGWEIDFETNVAINTASFVVVLDFVKPNITGLDTFEDFGLEGFGKIIPPFRSYINAALDPGQLMSPYGYELL
jgi:hypothetical protein